MTNRNAAFPYKKTGVVLKQPRFRDLLSISTQASEELPAFPVPECR